ncbi:MAG: YegS/Rv2252/BmrU family lipid kinase [Ruminococcaceae bacterium]|nr:YegS/Rv2252/BmrU family lipid kinase [Oscillospiraceae bacterium]
MKKMLFIMNPFAGMRRANRYLSDIISLFNRADYEVNIRMTAGTGDAANFAEAHSVGMDLVVCCGGDGTLNETITGMLRAGATAPIGYIPAGSTNDFAASLKLSTNIMQAAQDILEGEATFYDVGRFGDRYFSYVASFGAFTKSSYATPQSVKNALGHTAYVLEGISELSQIRPLHIRMEMENETVEDDFIFGCISNSTSIGGVLTLDPKIVDMADGLLEVFLVRAPRNLTEISECIQALQSQRYNDCAMITFGPARKIRVSAPETMPWTLDGEKYDGQAEIEVENLHHAIRLMKRVDTHA